MNWHNTMKATALAILAERTATAGRISVDAPWSWNLHNVWLTRARQPGELTAQASKSDPSVPPRQGPALRN